MIFRKIIDEGSFVPETVIRKCSVKKVFFKISQYSQENTSAVCPATLFKKRLQHMCFPMNILKCLRTPIMKNTSDDCFCCSRNDYTF